MVKNFLLISIRINFEKLKQHKFDNLQYVLCITSCSGAPVASRHAMPHHADRHNSTEYYSFTVIHGHPIYRWAKFVLGDKMMWYLRFCPCFVSLLFCIELYFELFSCNAPASARRLIKNLLTYLLLLLLLLWIQSTQTISSLKKTRNKKTAPQDSQRQVNSCNVVDEPFLLFCSRLPSTSEVDDFKF